MRKTVLAVMLACASVASAQEGKLATLYSEKIHCDACAAVITKALRGVPGVSKVNVDVEKKEVLVQFDPAKASAEDLTAATEKKGFPSSVRKVSP